MSDELQQHITKELRLCVNSVREGGCHLTNNLKHNQPLRIYGYQRSTNKKAVTIEIPRQ